MFEIADQIEQLLFGLILNQSSYLKFLNTYLSDIHTGKGLCLGKKMWRCSSSTVLNSGLDSRLFFILGHYGPPSTGRIQQLVYNANHKLGAAMLLKLLIECLLIMTFEKGKKFD